MKLAIIMPCFNEERRLATSALRAWIDEHPQATLYLVDDGSTDQTGSILAALADRDPSHFRHLSLDRNRGKAACVRRGMLQALDDGTWDWIGFLDADLATPLSEVDRLLAVAAGYGHMELVLGSRVKKLGSRIARRWYRHYLARIAATLISWTLRLGVYDSQCGAKFFRPAMARAVFADPFISRWLFDVEILARAIGHLGRGPAATLMVEISLSRWRDVRGSKLTWSSVLVTPLHLLRIRRRYRNVMRRKTAPRPLGSTTEKNPGRDSSIS